MSIQRWDPWKDIITLREAMNSLLEESFVRPRAGLTAFASGMAVDLRETDDAFVIETVLPGVKSDDVEISVLGETLRIAAEMREDEVNKEAKWLIRERRYGRFERTLTLPSPVKADEAAADFRDGILTVTLPKTEMVQPRSIPVRQSAGEPTES